ncbi:DUF4157 domain-containing protein [Pelagibius sp. Alg239-R121]|uniref:eCIS core domain-containing protein n=1 Tax=Pelagibius sp. Alg239-R121 TaxID=2993448 RepID=UPI0024A6D4BD|nr:DUF4157 domain-containing protein [Pelagibius sp. Alg239-R121]
MRARAKQTNDVLSVPVSAALATPARGLGAERAGLEARLGGDLSSLRIHEGPAVDRASSALGARGFAVGRDVALSRMAVPDTLAHEAVHALQQGMAEPTGRVPVSRAGDPAEREAQSVVSGGGPITGGHGLRLSRDLVSPGRLGDVHQGVRVDGPPRAPASPGGSTQRKPWVDGALGSGGTADHLFTQAFNFLDARNFNRPASTNTTNANLDSDAVAMHKRVTAHFPQISSPLSDTEIENRVSLMKPSVVSSDADFLNQWMDNVLEKMSDSEDFDIDPTNVNYRAMITKLINDTDVGPKIVTLAARQSAFARGEAANREIFVHPRVQAGPRQTTLIHEIVHLYRHTRYKAWVDASRDIRHYNEGLTEWLARKVMTSTELTGRNNYQARVDTVQDQIGANVSEDGVARAFFLGEVWRLETRSAEARSAFEDDTGIREGSNQNEERKASRSGSGLFQTVVPGEHFRFLNLGFGEAQPKTEHETAFQSVKTDRLDSDPQLKVRFVGHSSGPGSDAANMDMSRRRSVAFYRMAHQEGVPWNRMVDANRPPHFGESRPTVTEEDAITRAMNRRVEMFLIRGGTP